MAKKSRKEYMKAYRAKRKAEGICVRCGKPTNNGHCSCDECLEVGRIKVKNRRMQEAIDKWKEA